MKKILLLHPPRYLQKIGGGFFAAFNLIRHNRGVDRLPGVTPPTELALLATVLSARYTVEVLDANALNLLPREVFRKIRSSAPDMVIIRAGDSTFIEDIAYYYFSEGIGIPAIVWENHLSFMFAERMQREFGIKRLLGGDPEQIVFDCIESGAEGYFYGEPFDIASLPSVRLDLLPVDRYLYENRRVWFVEQSRGCGWGKCTFCMRSRPGANMLSYRSLTVIEEELKSAAKHGIEHIFFWGDDLNSSQERLESIVALMGKMNFSWECWMRVSGIDGTVLRAMKKSGCERITFGVENGMQEVLDRLEKGIAVDDVPRVFRACRRVGIRPVASLFIGSPHETPESLKKTWSLVKALRPEQILISCYRPFAETKLFEEARRERLLTADLFETAINDGFFGRDAFIGSRNMTREEIEHWYRRFSRLATVLSFRNYLVQPAKWIYAFKQLLLKVVREYRND
jgi:radical SAM superfamily enzyme YgiQ (UPF0313 family)